MKLILASASPRRLELLARIGLAPTVMAADIDESVLPGESPADFVLRVATDKAHVVWASVRDAAPGRGGISRREAVVLAADTAVIRDGEPLGKPVDRADAIAMLSSLTGRSHDVLTAVVAIGDDGVEHSVLSRATVTMASADHAEIEWYVSTGEPMDKAGSYAIQGIGAVLVERIEGDPTTVIGLPLRDTVELLGSAGIHWPT